MAVLDGKLGKSCWDPIQASRIEGLEFFPEQPMRPSVRNQVVKFYHQRMVVFVKTEYLDPQRRLISKIERLAQQLPRLPSYGGRSLALEAMFEMEEFGTRPSCPHSLHRLTQIFAEGRSQHLVALADRCYARLQGIEIHRPGQTGHFRNVVIISGRIELAEEED